MDGQERTRERNDGHGETRKSSNDKGLWRQCAIAQLAPISPWTNSRSSDSTVVRRSKNAFGYLALACPETLTGFGLTYRCGQDALRVPKVSCKWRAPKTKTKAAHNAPHSTSLC